MSLMYILFEGFDTDNGTNHLALKTINTFLENGVGVHLVTSHSRGLHPDIPEELLKYKNFSFTIIKRQVVNKKNFIQRYLDGVIYSLKAGYAAVKNKDAIKCALIQSTYTAFFTAVPIALLAKKPFIYNCFDMLPDSDRNLGTINNPLILSIFERMFSYIYRNSYKIVVISEDMRTTFEKKRIPREKLVLIRNWYNSDQVKEIDSSMNRFIQKYNIDTTKFIVQYAGNFGFTFDYRAIIEIAKRLRDNNEVQFHMIGTGALEKDFRKEAEENNLSNIVFLPWQTSDVISDVYSSCSIEIIPLGKQVISTSFPSKVSLVMACKRTFLCMTEKKSYFYKSLNQNNIGRCVDYHDYDTAANTIIELSHNHEELKTMTINAFTYSKQIYSSKNNAYKYIEIYKSI